MSLAENLADNIENIGGDISYVGNPRMVGKEWAFEVATLGNKTTLITRYASVSRARTDEVRNDLIDELGARGVEVIEVERVMLPAVDGLASIALH